MKDYYDIMVSFSFGVLAENLNEAQQIAKKHTQHMLDVGFIPGPIRRIAYLTQNQSDELKEEAVNHPSKIGDV